MATRSLKRKHPAVEKRLVPRRLERMHKHILEGTADRLFAEGYPADDAVRIAERIAAATVNKRRAALAKGKTTCRVKRGRTICRTQHGPKLIGQGGGRQQWYPGKRRERENFVCLEHRMRFANKARWKQHMTSKAHSACCANCAAGRKCDGAAK